MTVFRCTNCLWEGTVEEMGFESGFHYCPTCCASFDNTGEHPGPWEVAEVLDDPDGLDYGDFDEDGPY